jgi:hypothetical protein
MNTSRRSKRNARGLNKARRVSLLTGATVVGSALGTSLAPSKAAAVRSAAVVGGVLRPEAASIRFRFSRPIRFKASLFVGGFV